MAYHIHLPDRIEVDSLDAMFAARDGLLAMWEHELIEPELAQLRLKALTVRDASGCSWMMRPTEHGLVLICMSPAGDTVVADPADFVPQRRRSVWTRLFTAAGALLWVIVAVLFITQ